MTASIALVLISTLVVATIGGIVSAFFVHDFLWDRLPHPVANTLGSTMGFALCAVLVFTLMWQLNPDPAPDAASPPTINGTATLTGFSALLWVPLYLVSYAAIARTRRTQ